MSLTFKERELANIGASVATGCKPCTDYHFEKVRKAGVPHDVVLGIHIICGRIRERVDLGCRGPGAVLIVLAFVPIYRLMDTSTDAPHRRVSVEVAEVTRTGRTVRSGRFMATRVVALVEHPAIESDGGVDETAQRRRGNDGGSD